MTNDRHTGSFAVLCAWCGRTIGTTTVLSSHGICPACTNALFGLPDLTPAELDALPYGIIGLDRVGVVRVYNATEAREAGRERERVVGRAFFEDIAPCANVREFAGRFRALADGEAGRVETFRFRFVYADRVANVQIAIARAASAVSPVAAWIAIVRV